MLVLIQIVIVCVIVLVGVYFAVHIRKIPQLADKPGWLSGLLAGALLFIVYNVLDDGLLILVFLFFSYLLTDLFNLVIRGRYWKILYRSNVLALILTVGVTAYGYWNMDDIVLTRYTLETEKITENVKLVMISDLHLGTTMGTGELAEQCERIQEMNPDYVLLVGDLFDESTENEDVQEACQILGELQSRYGTYYVYGNHESYSFWRGESGSIETTLALLEAQGIHVLTDDVVKAGELAIIGRRDRSTDRQELSDLLEENDSSSFTLLMDHQPVDMKQAAELGVDLQVSGHTHAGQIWPLGLFIPYVSSNDMNYGLREEGGFTAIVSSGIGGWGFPLRTEGKSEIVEIELIASQSHAANQP